MVLDQEQLMHETRAGDDDFDSGPNTEQRGFERRG